MPMNKTQKNDVDGLHEGDVGGDEHADRARKGHTQRHVVVNPQHIAAQADIYLGRARLRRTH